MLSCASYVKVGKQLANKKSPKTGFAVDAGSLSLVPGLLGPYAVCTALWHAVCLPTVVSRVL